jgi:hypothetical protein
MIPKKDSSKSEIKTTKPAKASNIEPKQPSACSINTAKPTSPYTISGTKQSSDTAANQNCESKYSQTAVLDQKPCSQNRNESTKSCSADKKENKTRLTIKCDTGFSNQLYIRGKGANLNWNKGQPLKNIKADEWTWETDEHFTNCEFKILMNDNQYETGDNHSIQCGAHLLYSPRFA